MTDPADTDDILSAQAHSVHHRAEIDASDRCGCFSCCKTFRPAAIVAWIKDDASTSRQTARCPECGIDAVIGSASGLPLTATFLKRMRMHWYRR